MAEYNIYCDESCNLERDRHEIMVLGAVWCPRLKTREKNEEIRNLRVRHGLSKNFEIKWGKISPAKLSFYIDLVEHFFDDDDLNYRGLVAVNKDKLRHDLYGQSHDTWYYKMYYYLLKPLIKTGNTYNVYLDIKDSRMWAKAKKLHEVLNKSFIEFGGEVIKKVQPVHSREIGIIQITDFLTGALSYVNRGLGGSYAKASVIQKIKERADLTLSEKTAIGEKKFNIFIWEPSEGVRD
jgi:hypothetical protein